LHGWFKLPVAVKVMIWCERLTNIEVLSQLMRGLMIATMMLLLPLASAISSPTETIIYEPDLEGLELVLILDEGIWTQGAWSDLENRGLSPLRALSDRAVLVWSEGFVFDERGFEIQVADNADWRGAIDGLEAPGSLVKIVLEPRLPISAYKQIAASFASLGVDVSDMLPLSYSTTPFDFTITLPSQMSAENILLIPGILWIEPVLDADARNIMAAGYMGNNQPSSHQHWEFGLNGAGVILGVADSGIDLDHACFRNATAPGSVGTESNGQDAVVSPGPTHRKILLYNSSIDDGDTPGHMDYRHGTHVTGSLACHDIYSYSDGVKPTNASTMSYDAKIIFQDIVSSEGWSPPENVTDLLMENSINGGIIHSNSWGDDTTSYTARSADFDLWALEVPWSLAFIAPGNTGAQLLEPANARNVVAVGASTKSASPTLWPSSSIGPTEAETFGIFAVAPGVSINSAKADGIDDSLNNNMRVSSGTSMATPIAASFAGVLQQMVEQGWIMGSNEPLNVENMSDISPNWSSIKEGDIGLGHGFTPSGSLIRSLLAIATVDVAEEDDYFTRNNYSGWGALSLTGLIDFQQLENSLGQDNLTPTENLWIHDSFRSDINISDWIYNRLDGSSSQNIGDNPWNGLGAEGPFLETGDVWQKRLVPEGNEDLEIIMSFPAKPEPFLVDDLQLVVKMSNGYSAVGGIYDYDGYSSLVTSEELDVSELINSNETSIGVKISQFDLVDVEWVELSVHANYIAPGNSPGTVGVDGNRLGFAVAVKGVARDSINWEDADGDGIANAEDLCPNEHPQQFDVNLDGCSDDTDEDGIEDQYDFCPEINPGIYDNNLDGCTDDSDNDGIGDDVDVCITEPVDNSFPVNSTGCRPLDDLIVISNLNINGLTANIWDGLLNVSWVIGDSDFDPYITGSRIMINQTGSQSYFPILSCLAQDVALIDGVHFCSWRAPDDLPIFNINGMNMHVQIFAQSLNASPNANNDIQYVDSEIYFSANNWIVDEGLIDEDEAGAANPMRAMGWGLITVLGVALIAKRLWDSMKDEVEDAEGFQEVREPFVGNDEK
tara:strand:- start:37 stop:3225 length:3189 start_codon:yes stop_codon:yes gene_type:complete